MQNQLRCINETVKTLQTVVMSSGVFKENNQKGNQTRGKKSKVTAVSRLPFSNSATTIYQGLLEKQGQPEQSIIEEKVDDEISFNLRRNRGSTSSEDRVNTSDELLNIDCEKFIAECQVEVRRGCSPARGGRHSPDRNEPNPYERGEQLTRQADDLSTMPIKTPGRSINIGHQVGSPPGGPGKLITDMPTSNSFDKEYMVIGGHVDEVMQEKIINFEYVDFSRLIPKDRVNKAEDQRFELIVKGGNTFFSPVSEREVAVISNFSRWEQAFRIYSNIITKVYPAKASELIQYNHTIYTAALSFAWDNVYQYDREFRMHISKFPQRSWSVILQQAWSMYLKDQVKGPEDHRTTQKDARSRDICRRFNAGKCAYGPKCIFEHRCAVKKCGKFGHGVHICRLRRTDNAEGDKESDPRGQKHSHVKK